MRPLRGLPVFDGVVCMDGTPSSRVETNDSDGVAPTMLAFPYANTETTYGIQIQRTGGSTSQDTRVTTGAVLVSRESMVRTSVTSLKIAAPSRLQPLGKNTFLASSGGAINK